MTEQPVANKWSVSELIKTVSGPIAFVVSITTAYFTHFRAVDDIRVIVHSAPGMVVERSGVSFDGDIKLSIINAGNRLAVVTGAGITIASRKKQASEPDNCAGYPNEHELTVSYGVDQTSIEPQKMVPLTLAAIAKEPQGAGLSIPISDKKVTVCLRLQFATPDKADESGDVVLARDVEETGSATIRTFPVTAIGPVSVVKGTSLVLFKQ